MIRMRLRELAQARPRFGDLGRCHPWRLLRQCVSNGLAYGSELEWFLKRLMRPQPLGHVKPPLSLEATGYGDDFDVGKAPIQLHHQFKAVHLRHV